MSSKLDIYKDHVTYIGPSLPGNILPKYMTFTEGVPPHLEPVIKRFPAIGSLFIHVDDMPGHEQKLRSQGSYLNQTSNAVAQAVAQWAKTSVKKSR